LEDSSRAGSAAGLEGGRSDSAALGAAAGDDDEPGESGVAVELTAEGAYVEGGGIQGYTPCRCEHIACEIRSASITHHHIS